MSYSFRLPIYIIKELTDRWPMSSFSGIRESTLRYPASLKKLRWSLFLTLGPTPDV